jgi:hypothetical protein
MRGALRFGNMKQKTSEKPKISEKSREARLAENLRANLRRRKEQQEARTGASVQDQFVQEQDKE